jgi:hypothetical protein
MTDLKVLGPDGVLRDSAAWSTTTPKRFFTGTVPTTAADLEVSVRGAAFSTDPSLITFTASGWVVPNPAAYPDGLDLTSGTNVIQVRVVPLVGPPSAPVTATVTLLASGTGIPLAPPTGITVERLDNSVNISARGLDDARVTGYLFYASAFAGGGGAGYTRINANPVATPVRKEEVTALSSLTTKNLSAVADPLFVRLVVTQENLAQTTLQTDVDTRVEIPDTVTEIQTDVTLSSVAQVNYYEFLHNRRFNLSSTPSTIPVTAFAAIPTEDPLYYVVTAVYFDPTTQVEYESYYSPEVVASPIDVRIQTQALPVVSRQQIVQDAVASIYRSNRDIAVQPGSVIRDTFLDPFSSEAERVRFILDFIYRASSFDTLINVDDPTGSGLSVLPNQSAYKQSLARAFFLANVTNAQGIIDAAFDKLAANFGVTRTPGQRALGEVRFYTTNTPTASLQVPLGTLLTGGGRNYRTTRFVEIPFAQQARYFNPSTGEYSVTCPVQAEAAGSAGNVGPRQITSGAPYGLSVTNDASLFGGTDAETNSQLAARARRALSSVDTGTQQGYLQLAAGVPGVREAQVIEAGSPLMMRDFDPATGEHVGGKVDVWTVGARTATVTDTFAFTFVRKRDIQFVVVGPVGAYRLQALDPDLSPTNPIAEMLNYPALGLGLRNATTGLEYDLTGVTFINYKTIQLSLAVPQPPVTLTDVILGDYRYRTGEKFTFTRQPVTALNSVTGEVTGTLSTATYSLVRASSPLVLGNSTKAGDYLQITGSDDPTVTSPSGAILTVTNESHVIVGEYVEFVNRLGADSLTLVVTNATSTVTYASPFTSATPDYTIVEGTQTVPLGIKRTSTSAITDGETILISYNYDENFTVNYDVNLVTSAVQQAIDEAKHATADVLAKAAVSVPVDITATVILSRGAPRATVDQFIRANLGLLISSLGMGAPLRRSDVIATIDNTSGVAYVVVPLTTLSRGIFSQVVYDTIEVSQLSDSFRVNAWSNVTNAVWLLTDQLTSQTSTGGGPSGDFRGVYQSDYLLAMQTSLPATLGEGFGRSYIIGADGLVIPGYSDDATLTAQGYVTDAERETRRKTITQNRVLVSLKVGDAPSNYTYWATYTTTSSQGEVDIVTSDAEYVVPGTWTFTYDEDRT